MTKNLVRFAAGVLTTLLALILLWQFRLIIVYVLLSLMLAAALRPLVNRLVGARVMGRIAWILLILLSLGGFGSLIILTSGEAITQAQILAQSLSAQDAWLLPGWLEGSSFQLALIARLPPPSQLLEAFTGDQGQLVLPALLSASQGIGTMVTGVLIIVFLSAYWSINQIHFERLWLSLLPAAQRKEARGIWRVIEPDLGTYLRGQVLHSLLVGLLLFLGCWLLGSPYPALLALAGAIASLIPVVGIPLVLIAMLLVGLLTSVQLSLFTTLYALFVMIALGVWVKPRLVNRKWNHPILTVVLLIAMADAFGILGLVIAPPLSVVCQILWSRLVTHRASAGAAAQVSDLKERQARLRETVAAMKEPPPPLVTSSMERLSQLIAKAEPVLQAAQLGEPSGSVSSVQPVVGEGKITQTPEAQEQG